MSYADSFRGEAGEGPTDLERLFLGTLDAPDPSQALIDRAAARTHESLEPTDTFTGGGVATGTCSPEKVCRTSSTRLASACFAVTTASIG